MNGAGDEVKNCAFGMITTSQNVKWLRRKIPITSTNRETSEEEQEREFRGKFTFYFAPFLCVHSRTLHAEDERSFLLSSPRSERKPS
jgi:hypothetical protein